MNLGDAISAACALLKDEANQLALPSNYENYEKLPHRAKVAIRLEVDRLRAVAATLGAAKLASEHSDSEHSDSDQGPQNRGS